MSLKKSQIPQRSQNMITQSPTTPAKQNQTITTQII